VVADPSDSILTAAQLEQSDWFADIP
jgi:hypothetical protein